MPEAKCLNKEFSIGNRYPLVSIVVINFNGKKYLGNILDDCISSILNSEYNRFEVLFVDNGSSDGSIGHVKGLFGSDDRIRIISLGRNYGTTKAKNEGIKASKGDTIFILNNDIILKKETLLKLVEVMKSDPDIGIIGPKLISPSGEIQSEGESFSELLSLLNIISPSLWEKKTKMETKKLGDLNVVDWLVGAALMVRRDMVMKLNLYDEDYFMYAEETDLAYRAKKAGYKVACLTTCEAIHYGDATARHFSVWKSDLLARNELLFIQKNYSKTKLARALLLFTLRMFRYLVHSSVTFNGFELETALSRIKAFSYIRKRAKPPN